MMLKVGSKPAPGLCVHARPLPVFCQSKGFGKSRKVARKMPVKEQQQQQEILSPSQSKSEAPRPQPTFLSEDTSDPSEEVPEEISNRILRRILVFAGIPTVSGILSLPLFYYLKVFQHWEIPTWGVYIASFLTFGVGVLGISYGAISASWTEQEGSALGFKEFQKNLPFALDRLRGR